MINKWFITDNTDLGFQLVNKLSDNEFKILEVVCVVEQDKNGNIFMKNLSEITVGSDEESYLYEEYCSSYYTETFDCFKSNNADYRQIIAECISETCFWESDKLEAYNDIFKFKEYIVTILSENLTQTEIDNILEELNLESYFVE
ncbi:hypothetical protein ACSW8S_17155 (plasmid) [Clostridium perfringens]